MVFRITEAASRRSALAVVCALGLMLCEQAQASSTPVVALGFDEGQGAKVSDSSPNARHGTMTGARWSDVGRFGKALDFDGTGFVTIPEHDAGEGADITIEAWVKPRDPGSLQAIVVPYNNYMLGVGEIPDWPGTDPAMPFAGGEVWLVKGTEPLKANVWTHLAATFDEDLHQWRLYVDGELVADAFGVSPGAKQGTIDIGSGHRGDYGFVGFDGLIDEVRIYGRALAESEIRRDMVTRIARPLPETTPKPVMALGFEEGTGGWTADSSTHGNSGQVRGAAWTTEGKFGSALRFNGGGDVVTVPDSPTLALEEMTLEMWVKPRSFKHWSALMMKEQGTEFSYILYAAANLPWLDVHAYPAFMLGGAPSGAWDVFGDSALPIGQWSHLSATFDGTTMKLYVNGVLVSSAPGEAPPHSNDPLTIGGYHAWHDEYFDGVIDEVRIYDTALTLGQIQADRDTPVRRSGARSDEPPTPAPPAAPEAPAVLTSPLAAAPAAPAAKPAPRPAAARQVARSTKKAAARKKAAKRCVATKRKVKGKTVRRCASKARSGAKAKRRR